MNSAATIAGWFPFSGYEQLDGNRGYHHGQSHMGSVASWEAVAIMAVTGAGVIPDLICGLVASGKSHGINPWEHQVAPLINQEHP